MDRPARLPITAEDFDEWSVYADWLQARGEPRGEPIALELAMPEAPDPDQLAAFHASVPSAPGYGVEVTYALGYVHTLRVPRDGSGVVEARSLELARSVLATEAGALVEEIELAFDPERHLPHVHALLAALPPSCRRIGLDLYGPITIEAARGLAADLPPHVRELAMSAHGPRLERIGLTGMSTWIDDQLDAVELRFTRSTFERALGQLDLDRTMLVERDAHTRRVRQQWTAVAAPFPRGRIELGRPGDAAVVDLGRRRAIVVSRSRPFELQEQFGQLPIRTRRSGRLPERYDLPLYLEDLTRSSRHVALDRNGDAWTLTHRPSLADDGVLRVNGIAVAPDESIEIGDGDRIETEHGSFALVAHDVTRTVRALLA